MKKALIILFYWPPGGGSSVQRWLHFSNYLPEHGWEPIVYIPANAQYPETDNSLENRIRSTTKIIRKKIFEPYNLYRKFTGISQGNNLPSGMTLKEKPGSIARIRNDISLWIRGNFFIPDARMFWIKPSVTFLKRFLHTEKVDLIITTGPPHSLHLIGYHLNKNTKIPWIADFRDPWTKIDFYSELKLTRLADRYHHHLERKVLQNANLIITVGEDMKKEFIAKGANNVEVITNGYDEEDLPKEKAIPDNKFSLLHIGTFSRTRNSEALWRAIQEILSENPDFQSDLEIKLIGNVDYSVIQSIEENNLKPYLHHIHYLPHQEAMKAAHSAQVLLLMINRSENAKGILTGKFFEYLTTGRPILLIGPTDGDAAKILKETETGKEAAFEDMASIKQIIIEFYQRYRHNNLFVNGRGIENYSRKTLTEKLAGLMDYATMKDQFKQE